MSLKHPRTQSGSHNPFKASTDIENDLTSITNKGHYDLLLIMLGKSMYEGSLLGRLLGFTTKIINPEKLLNTVKGKEISSTILLLTILPLQILDKTNIPVGVLVEKIYSCRKGICSDL
jgi:hypothetical protein